MRAFFNSEGTLVYMDLNYRQYIFSSKVHSNRTKLKSTSVHSHNSQPYLNGLWSTTTKLNLEQEQTRKYSYSKNDLQILKIVQEFAKTEQPTLERVVEFHPSWLKNKKR